MMRRTRLELAGMSGLTEVEQERVTEAQLQAALKARRIASVDWDCLAPYEGADRKLNGIPLAVRVIAVRHGLDSAEPDEEE